MFKNNNYVEYTASKDNFIETFVPLYISNYCDCSCTICSMRSQNRSLKRIDGSLNQIIEQLKIIRRIENISSICLLSGELKEGSSRKSFFAKLQQSVLAAHHIGIEKIYLNVGAFSIDEMKLFAPPFTSQLDITLSIFQETYNRQRYAKYFSTIPAVPKADFDRRYATTFDWIQQGFKNIDLGILLGLGEPEEDVESLISHATKLFKIGGDIAISLPRIRGITQIPIEIDDNSFIEIVRYINSRCPWAKIIISTRESINLINSLLPFLSIVAPGTSDVLPYTNKGMIPNNRSTSQFYVADWRLRPSDVLLSLAMDPTKIKYFYPSQEQLISRNEK